MESVLVTCPHCHAVNRIPQVRLGDHPDCGRCHRPLFDGLPIELDDHNIDAVLARTPLPVIVDFWAAWCGPCRQMAPQFQAAAQQMKGSALFAKVDSDACPEASARHAIRSIPTMVAFQGGREVGRLSGAMPAAQIVRWVEDLTRG
ncbi:thioredoxin TrxC [Sphaerotilus uruguayifluvii]|uniref:Thioredoxin n=1 Tax=Sphaerotilus uruguayifluvii TaxID=2735897 RepID=A0ABX2G4X3_9BURK|nr:thioredoxin TrxC [Leptothrix sp. C29]NRT56766.1 thioredoxin 2 [Leptothrix sp. C29]